MLWRLDSPDENRERQRGRKEGDCKKTVPFFFWGEVLTRLLRNNGSLIKQIRDGSRGHMREDAFRSWLSTAPRKNNGRPLDARTVGSRFSNCRTVERYEGDLDQQFDQDHLRGLLERLKYSTEQEKQKRPAAHRIPINGSVRNVTATLKSAVSLYKQFREDRVEGTPILAATAKQGRAPSISRAAKSLERGAWPTWDQPDPEQVLTLARLTVPFVRFLNPDVVRSVVEDNERHRAMWIEALQSRQIDPAAYLWDRSPCAFPGVRRSAGSKEIAAHKGHTRLDENQSNTALKLDDNDYPKQLWSFVFRGSQFSKKGPESYSLAHLADHKDHGNRFGQDFEVTDGGLTHRLFGLYTCPSNTAYIPRTLIKPTDFDGTIRALLVRRAQQLYGEFCEMLPPFLRIPEASSAEWNVDEFTWADPVGTTKHIKSFLAFRRDRLAKLINAHDAQREQIAQQAAIDQPERSAANAEGTGVHEIADCELKLVDIPPVDADRDLISPSGHRRHPAATMTPEEARANRIAVDARLDALEDEEGNSPETVAAKKAALEQLISRYGGVTE